MRKLKGVEGWKIGGGRRWEYLNDIEERKIDWSRMGVAARKIDWIGVEDGKMDQSK